MRGLLIAVSVAAAAPGAHADAAYPEGCFSPPVCVTVERTQATLDFNFESLADQPYTVAVSSSQHDPTTVYALPFKNGRWVWVVQAYDDPRSHSGSQRFAIDFGVPIGTEIRAARDGMVIGADATSNESSRDGVRMARANYVWVRHRDGTVAYYLHLRHGGVAVALGQTVKTGQLLGYSGCTGQCAGPHLHFHVSTPLQAHADPKFEAYRTFPTVFSTNGGTELLEPNRSYLVQ